MCFLISECCWLFSGVGMTSGLQTGIFDPRLQTGILDFSSGVIRHSYPPNTHLLAMSEAHNHPHVYGESASHPTVLDFSLGVIHHVHRPESPVGLQLLEEAGCVQPLHVVHTHKRVPPVAGIVIREPVSPARPVVSTLSDAVAISVADKGKAKVDDVCMISDATQMEVPGLCYVILVI